MIRKFVICATLALFGAGLLMAHGDPILGTVTEVTKDTITIKNAKDNKDLHIMVDAKTKYLLGTKAAKLADIKVGQKVSIDAMMDTKMKMYVAESVAGPAAAVKAAADAKPAATKAASAAAPKAAPKK
ncbi:MAG TPA: DUF5666 domain-containing protein [Terriglobia bacterium]|nr:DUF5666 domain-containing protein [Terriglobia bacterium]